MNLESQGHWVEWFVVWKKSNHRKGLFRYLKPGMSHVYAVRKSRGGAFWIIVDPLLSHITVDMIPVDKFPHIRLYAGEEAVILPVRAKINPAPRYTLCIFNCVEVVKGLLGIRSFWTFTPWQLYKLLKKGRKWGSRE